MTTAPSNVPEHRVLITEFIDETALDAFPSHIRYSYLPGLVDQREKLLAQIEEYDAIIVRNRTRVDVELLARANGLKAVGRLGVGLDNIDLERCAELDIKVLPATGANTRSVAEYVIASILLTVRGAFSATTELLAGDWPRATLGQGGEICGRTLGLIGFGTIAQATASLAKSLGMRVIAYDPYQSEGTFTKANVSSCTIEECLSTADVVSLHIPYTPDTRGFINSERLAQMRKGATLINTARGEVIDLSALAEALNSDHLGRAVIDVFESEPPDSLLLEQLRRCKNLILTPHIAGVTSEANARVSHLTVANVIQALDGEANHG